MSGQNRRASHQGKVPPAQVCEYGGRVSRTECCLKGIYMPPIASKAIGGITTPTRPHYKTDWLPPFLHSPPKRESEGSVNGILYQVTGRKCTRLDEDHRIGLLPTGRKAVYPPERGCRGLGRSENPTLVARTTGAERQGGFCRPAERPFIPLKGGAGGLGRSENPTLVVRTASDGCRPAGRECAPSLPRGKLWNVP